MTHLFDTNAWLRATGPIQELNIETRDLIFNAYPTKRLHAKLYVLEALK